MDDESYLHEATKEVIKKVVHTDPLVLAKVRLATVFNLRKLTDELREKEATLTQSLHPDVRKRAESKNIALFEHVLQKLGFCDMRVGALLKEGVPLVGSQAAPPGYKQQLVPATMTEKELLKTAQW
jgi:hypothetical protein